MATSTYSHLTRIIACDNCGAAADVPLQGGTGNCQYCRAPIAVYARPDTTVPPSAALPEQERLARLRQQDGRPLLPPPGLEQILSQSGTIEAWRMQEARQVWGQTRKHLAGNPADIAAAERLLFLTLALSNSMSGAQRDDRALRALYEGALEVFTLSRHRQMMRGYLARNAARNDDIAGAQAWLARCDPASDDLMTDSTYRVTAAYVATATQDFQGVLRAIGTSDAEVPIADMMDPIAAVLRANALERLGQLDAARDLLARFMAAHGGVSSVVQSVVSAMPAQWNMCAQSFAAAHTAHRQHVGARAGSGSWLGWLLIIVGILPAAITIPVLLSAGQGMWYFGLITLVFPLAFSLTGVKMLKAAKRQRAIAEGGISGTGRVVSLQPTGLSVNHVPQMLIVVQGQVPGHPPFQAGVKKILHPHQASMLMGRELPIVWHPSYPNEVVLEI